MNIAIIGGGWVGCHLSNNLKKDHNVTLFEKIKHYLLKHHFLIKIDYI